MEQTNTNNYLDKLMETARNDGIVTEHEKIMIKRIMEGISDYYKILEQALSDNVITSEEKIDLYKFRIDIFIENMKFVNEDKIITLEEVSLIETLNKILAEMGDLENKFTNFV